MPTRTLLLSALTCLVLPGAERIFLFAGQSNMCGYGTNAADLTTADQASTSSVQCLYSVQEAWGKPSPESGIATGDYWRPTNGTWEDFAAFKQKYWYVGPNPGDPWTTMGAGSGGAMNDQFGPEFNAARTLQATLGGTIRIVKYAKGGTSLQNDWATTGNLYRSMKYWADKALASRPGATIAGFFWMQGEADATFQPGAGNYQSNLTNFIAKVRTDFADPHLPFILGRIHTGNPSHRYATYIDVVRQAQAAVATAVPKVAWVNTDDLALTADDLHLSTTGMLQLGTRMGQAWLSLTTPAGPNVTLSTSAPAITAADTIPFTITFSEPVTGFSVSDLQITNATVASFSGSGAHYSAVLTPLGDGTITLTVPASVANTSAGAANRAADHAASVISDRSGPTVALAVVAGQALPLTATPARWSVVFNRAVTGLTRDDLQITTTSGGTLRATLSGSGARYELAIDGLLGSGEVSIALPADAAQDASGHPNRSTSVLRTAVAFSGSGSGTTSAPAKDAGGSCGMGTLAALASALGFCCILRRHQG